MPLPDPQFDQVFDQMARSSARTVDSLVPQGLSVPAGAAERFGHVFAEFLRNRRREPSEALFNIGMSRLREILEATAAELPAGGKDPGFLDVFARRLREEFESYERTDPAASA